MSNSYITSCFSITVNNHEADLIKEAARIQETLWADDETVPAQAPSEAFMAKFPPTEADDPLSGFMQVFSDGTYPVFDANISYEPVDADNTRVRFNSEQFDPETIARVLHVLATTAFPICATWSITCDKNRDDHFSGGGFRITEAGIDWISADDVRRPKIEQPAYVLATHDDEDGLLFFSLNDGFGDLASATVFTDADRATPAFSLTNPETRWMRLPSRTPNHD